MIATSARLDHVLTALAHLIESQVEGLLCSVLFLNGGRLWHAAAPSLPEAYIRSIDGIPVGPKNGSCGTAAYRREPVIVTDILEDPLWEDHRRLAVPHGLRACWSCPFFSFQGEVLGTFAMYYGSPRSPGFEETQLISVATQIATVAVERWRSDEELRRAVESYRALVENLNDIVFSLDLEGSFTYVSPPIEHLSGYRVSEVIGAPFARFIHPEDLSVLRRSFADTLAGKLTPCEFRVLDKRGAIHWCRTSNRPRIVADQVVGVNGVLVDITEQRKTQEALLEAERKYRSIFEGAVVGIFQSAPDGHYITANQALAHMLGYDSHNDLTTSITNIFKEIYVDPERWGEFMSLMEKDGGVRDFEHEVYRKDGSKRWLSTNARAVYRDRRIVAYEGTCEDITERELLAEQFLHAQKMEAIGQLAGGVAHDFNNLLGVILGHGELLLQRLSSSDPWRRRMQQICHAAQRGASLTEELLAFARRQKLPTTVLNLNELVANIDDVIQRLIGENIRVVNKLDPALGCVKADATQVEQVILNLAVNARDAMPQGGTLTIETSNVEVEGTATRDRGVKKGRYVLLSVRDTGTGMDQATLARIFEPFFTTKEPGKGTGLGLSTVYGIVEQSGGQISVTSELGQGTTFSVYLPRTEGAVEAPQRSDAGPVLAKRDGETILLVEDATPLRQVTREFLEGAGYRVLEASNGDSALGVADSHKAPISAMITDVVMPGMNGPILAERLRSTRPQTKVLYVSGYADDAILRHNVSPTGKHFLRKPYTQNQLTSKLREILDAGTLVGQDSRSVPDC
jgi:PAS domain S-box-containing protein